MNPFERYLSEQPSESEWQAREEEIERQQARADAAFENSVAYCEENWVEVTEFRKPAAIERMQMSLNFGEVA